MLILTRRLKESIMVGSDVKVTVLSFKGNQIRLGIEAPDDVEVHREEIYLRIQKGNKNCYAHKLKEKSQNPYEIVQTHALASELFIKNKGSRR